ncbi:MAG: TRAP transporter small permease [Pseudomonadota bacterium]|nr:TRAP transporter small permease [Pseudomonadota bacterium]
MLDRLNRLLVLLAAVALFVVIAITLFDIVLALVTGRPYSGVYDIVQAFLAASVFLAMPIVFRGETNIQVNLIDGLLGPKARAVNLFIARLATLAFMIIIGWSEIQPFRDTILFGDILYETGLKVWIIWIPILIGTALSILMVVTTFWRGHQANAEEVEV